jgi:hypothetical protein
MVKAKTTSTTGPSVQLATRPAYAAALVTRPPLDPERGAEAAGKLKDLGVTGVLIKAAELGYITEVTCGMPRCFCPEELGGAGYFVPRTKQWNDWEATFEHFPISKLDGGRTTVDNAVLAHRLCNKLDHSIRHGLSIEKDLARVKKAREAGNSYVADVDSEPHTEQIKSEPKPKKVKKAAEWKSWPNDEKAEHLLSHQTLSDRTWTDEPRLKGEKRDAFIRRILLG